MPRLASRMFNKAGKRKVLDHPYKLHHSSILFTPSNEVIKLI